MYLGDKGKSFVAVDTTKLKMFEQTRDVIIKRTVRNKWGWCWVGGKD